MDDKVEVAPDHLEDLKMFVQQCLADPMYMPAARD
jgi:hypothetical protein